MDRFYYKNFIMAYKPLHDMKDMYTYVSNINSRSIRHSDDKSKLYLAPQNNYNSYNDFFPILIYKHMEPVTTSCQK